jgi:hypothetical protein
LLGGVSLLVLSISKSFFFAQCLTGIDIPAE